jgi:DNA repair protein RecN (Recombination protein N)
MIISLSIRNYALIESLEAEFTNGLVIITGETGAGKSIIIGALGLLLGERASTDAVRSGAEKAVVEGLFSVAGNRKVARLLQENDIDSADTLIVRREVSARGQSRCFLNDTPVTLTLQKQAGQLLVDLHGQHEHQSLLRTETHIELLDEFGGLDRLLSDFAAAHARLREVESSLAELRRREEQLREKRELYQYQVQEIDAVSPQGGEEDALEAELKILENAERLYEETGRLYQILYEGEQAAHDQLVVVRNMLEDLAAIDPAFREAASEGAGAAAVVAELAKVVQRYNASVEFRPDRLEEVRSRLGRLSLLKRKYGGSTEAVLAHRGRIGEELALAENFDEVLRSLASDAETAARTSTLAAERLSAKREETARRLDRGIVAELGKLGITHARFSTRISREEDPGGLPGLPFRLNARGCDVVEFMISTNLGEEEKPLARVASGGEVSRVMLALKSVLAKSDRLPVLVFDEVDTGVSGRIAQAVGRGLKALSSFHQVVAITHLPQIAGLADTHFVVEKSESAGRSTTRMRRLSLEERVEEVARLISGAEVTTTGRESARELMGLQG